MNVGTYQKFELSMFDIYIYQYSLIRIAELVII